MTVVLQQFKKNKKGKKGNLRKLKNFIDKFRQAGYYIKVIN